MTPQERIKADAEAYAERENSAYVNDYNGYIAGATAENDRVQPVIEAAEKVAKLFAHKGDHQTCAICQLARALEQWRRKEASPANDKCRCIQPNWNAFTGKCLTCGKP